MGKIRDCVFVLLVLVGLCSVIVVTVADRYLPGYSAQDKSYVEGSVFMRASEVLAQPILDGSFQASTEKYFSQHVPEYDALLLLQAKLQRTLIQFAANSFGYDAYHTFYGSNCAAVMGGQFLVDLPQLAPETANSQEVFCSMLNESARAHEEVRFVCDWLLEDRQTVQNPCYSLVSSGDYITEDWAYEHNVLPLDSMITAFVDPLFESNIESPKYASDVHWVTARAMESYNKVAEILDLEAVTWADANVQSVVPEWTGSQARTALDYDYPSVTDDDTRSFSELSFYKLGTKKPLSGIREGLRDSVLDGSISEEDAEALKHAGYTLYYGNGNAEILNSGKSNGRNLLLVGDSFSYSLKRYYAMNYARTIFIAPGNRKVEQTLDELIDAYEINDVVFVMHCNKTSAIADKSPKFLPVDITGGLDGDDA